MFHFTCRGLTMSKTFLQMFCKCFTLRVQHAKTFAKKCFANVLQHFCKMFLTQTLKHFYNIYCKQFYFTCNHGLNRWYASPNFDTAAKWLQQLRIGGNIPAKHHIVCTLTTRKYSAQLYTNAVENNTPISIQPYDNTNVSFLSNTIRFLMFLL